MKNIISIALFLLAQLSLIGQTDKFSLKVDGMGCAYCANGVEKKLNEWKTLSGLVIDLAKGTVQFEFPAKDSLSSDKVVAQIDAAGYTTTQIAIERFSGEKENYTYDKKTSHAGKKGEISLKVYGRCGMCAQRIEEAANSLKGVSNAQYNVETQTLTAMLNPKKTTVRSLEKAINKVGHDTEHYKAEDEVYEALHHCCKYERP
jgi:periplasmic mercuric ion binding protein